MCAGWYGGIHGREEDDVWLIECKEACPNVGGEERSSTASEMACEEGSPCRGRDVVIKHAYEQQPAAAGGVSTTTSISNCTYVCRAVVVHTHQARYRTSLTSVAGCLPCASGRLQACTSAIKVCIGGSSTCSNHGR